MPRIRTIKPEFWEDEHIAQLPAVCRLFYIGCWNYADDQGVFKSHPVYLKSRIFPYDDIDTAEILTFLHKLEEHKMIIKFSHERDDYYVIRRFSQHQVIDKRYFRSVVPVELVAKVLGLPAPASEATMGTHRGLAETPGQERKGSGEGVENKKNEEEIFYEFLFFRNVKDARQEVRRFVGYNRAKNPESSTYHSLPIEQKLNFLQMWQPKETGKRCSEEFLAMWQALHRIITTVDPDIAKKMLHEEVNGKWDANGSPVIMCKSLVIDFIKRNYDQLAETLMLWTKGKQICFRPLVSS